MNKVNTIALVGLMMIVGACGKANKNQPAVAQQPAVTPVTAPAAPSAPAETAEEKARSEKNKHQLDGFFKDPIGTLLPKQSAEEKARKEQEEFLNSMLKNQPK